MRPGIYIVQVRISAFWTGKSWRFVRHFVADEGRAIPTEKILEVSHYVGEENPIAYDRSIR